MMKRWELFVMRLDKSYCKNIYLSGSNAKMLSPQIATALRGWPMEFEAFPLSFSEYLKFKEVKASCFDEQSRPNYRQCAASIPFKRISLRLCG